MDKPEPAQCVIYHSSDVEKHLDTISPGCWERLMEKYWCWGEANGSLLSMPDTDYGNYDEQTIEDVALLQKEFDEEGEQVYIWLTW
jgi:hypothetical protein